MSIYRATSKSKANMLAGNQDIPNLEELQSQLATLQQTVDNLKLEILQAENPVGHIRMETTNVNPSTYLGFGTWVFWGAGKVPVGVDTTQTEFNIVEKTGGSKTHKHLGSITYIIHSGSPYVGISNDFGIKRVGNIYDFYGSKVDVRNVASDIDTGCRYYTTEDSSLQPYITCYMWKRTA